MRRIPIGLLIVSLVWMLLIPYTVLAHESNGMDEKSRVLSPFVTDDDDNQNAQEAVKPEPQLPEEPEESPGFQDPDDLPLSDEPGEIPDVDAPAETDTPEEPVPPEEEHETEAPSTDPDPSAGEPDGDIPSEDGTQPEAFDSVIGDDSSTVLPLPVIVPMGYERIVVPEEAFLYTAFDFYAKAEALAAAFPDLLRLETLGYSADGRPVFVLVLAEGIQERSYEELYIKRYQLLMEAGAHSRETINPYLLMRTIEDYCLDASDDTAIEGIHVGEILLQGTFHFLILSNPDGYDAVKHGPESIQNETLRQKLMNILDGQSVTLLKAGIDGVDRNKNFQDMYYSVSTGSWINQFYTKNSEMPTEPAMENYPGPYPASCVETAMVQSYIARYPFRALLSYHSMGRVIYYMKEYFSDSFNQNQLRPLAEVAAAVTGYTPIHYVSYDSAAGYLTHFAVNLLQKPALTVETTPERVYPIQEKYYEEEYARLQLLPYRSMEYVINKGYFLYRVYVGGKFFHDYQSKSYANAMAVRYHGDVVERVGMPVYEYIVVFNNGDKIPFSSGSGAPFIRDGRTMLPVRRVAEFLGATVDWNQGLYQAEIYWDDQSIKIPIDKDYIIVNGSRVQMDTDNILRYNRTYVPLRFVFQSMGYRVSWEMISGQHIIQIDSR